MITSSVMNVCLSNKVKKMNNEIRGRYERPFWLKRIRVLTEKINELSNEKINTEMVLEQCKQNDEDYCISTYLHYKKQYVDLFLKVLNE